MNVKEVERVVAKLQGQLFKNSNSQSIGMFKSQFRGSGLQFREHQVYTPGDDVRFIDWKLSAKSSRTYIKTFEEERNVEIIVCIDVRNSMLSGYKNVSKLQAAVEIACLLYLIAKETNDQVRVVLLKEKSFELPFCSGRQGIVTLITYLEKLGLIKNEKINLSHEVINEISEKEKETLLKSYMARKKEVIWITDIDGIDSFLNYKKYISYHNFHCLKVTTPLDYANYLPFSIPVKGISHFIFRNQSIQTVDDPTKDKKTIELNLSKRYLENFIEEFR